MCPSTKQSAHAAESNTARVPYVAVSSAAASHARGRSLIRIARRVQFGWAALGSAALLASAFQYTPGASHDPHLVSVLLWIAAACAGSAPIGWWMLRVHNRRSALEFLRSSKRCTDRRLGARLWAAQAFGDRGRRSLTRWVHRRSLPPILFAGSEPESIAFAEVQVQEQISLFSDPRPYPTQRPAFFGGQVSLPMILGIFGIITVTEFIGFADSLLTGLAVVCGIAAWRAFASRRGDYGRAQHDPNGIFRVVLVDVSGVTDSSVGRQERHFTPSDGLLFFEIEGGPDYWRSRNHLTTSVRVTLMNGHGGMSMFRLIGTDHPSIADLGARWLEGWRMAKQSAPSQPR